MCSSNKNIDLLASSGSHNKSKGDYGINKANLYTWHLKSHAMQACTQVCFNVKPWHGSDYITIKNLNEEINGNCNIEIHVICTWLLQQSRSSLILSKIKGENHPKSLQKVFANPLYRSNIIAMNHHIFGYGWNHWQNNSTYSVHWLIVIFTDLF